MTETSTIHTPDGITWHVERSGSGPDLVLVPSGEGDCSSFANVASLLAPSFRITTFDMPGMSRTVAPPAAATCVSPEMLANQIKTLMDALSIRQATFYGCSSGGATCLSLVKYHPQRVTSVIVHEVPLEMTPTTRSLQALDDEQIVKTCRYVFAEVMCEDKAAWEALGPEYHARLDRNYVTWLKEYVGCRDWEFHWNNYSKADITKRPVSWTIGALTPAGSFFSNVVMAYECRIPIGLLPSKHFPQVSIPEKLAEHLRDSAMKYL